MNETKKDKDKLITSFHEAGHAAVLRKVGARLKSVCLCYMLQESEWHGRVLTRSDESGAESTVMGKLAGPLAECHLKAVLNRNKEAGSKKVFEIVSSIRYDPEDALDRFIDDCTKPNDRERDWDADEEPTTKLQFLEATGARFAAEVEVRPFQDEVIEARNGARKRNLDLNALLRETRDLLNHPAVCAGLQRLARALYQARARELSIVELENHSQVGAWVREKLKPARDERAELIELCGAQAERLLECTFGDDLA